MELLNPLNLHRINRRHEGAVDMTYPTNIGQPEI